MIVDIFNDRNNLIMAADTILSLLEQIQTYIDDHPRAVMVEGGEVVFRFDAGEYSLRPERGRCLLHVWSEERNIVRRVTTAEVRKDHLRLSVQRFGQSKPTAVELVPQEERRPESARRVSRATFQRVLRHSIERQFPGWNLESLSFAADLEHSFGPVHVRGIMRQGQKTIAVAAVSGAEVQPSVDALLTTGILWLERCRERLADKRHVEGLRLIAPVGRSDVLRLRMAQLNRDAAAWELFELDQRTETLSDQIIADTGNIETRLVRLPDETAARRRFQKSIDRVLALVPRAEIIVRSPGEISFQICGLEFARVRVEHQNGFRVGELLTFGSGPHETPLNERTEPMLREAVARLSAARAGSDHADQLYRMQPERWLESVVRKDAGVLDERIDPRWVYAQVPAFAAGDRGMIDLLTVTRDGRLVVIELKAQEDLHLPLQGLDYWARVRWHQERDDFKKFGYFAGCELSDKPPILLLVSPALHLHPATDTLLRYLSPEIDWKVLGIGEHWRWGVRVVFRKSREDGKVVTRG
ncbi:MAG TPA: hypothetical protein VFU86_13960 [Terriglobales bacterium]|nr:hypothetical protein [Terriglobales bacterium]